MFCSTLSDFVLGFSRIGVSFLAHGLAKLYFLVGSLSDSWLKSPNWRNSNSLIIIVSNLWQMSSPWSLTLWILEVSALTHHHHSQEGSCARFPISLQSLRRHGNVEICSTSTLKHHCLQVIFEASTQNFKCFCQLCVLIWGKGPSNGPATVLLHTENVFTNWVSWVHGMVHTMEQPLFYCMKSLLYQ
jgi:hypothetical protein